MPASYYVALKNQAGARVAVFDKWFRLEYERHRNEPGWVKLELYLPDTKVNLFDLDYQVEVYRLGDWTGATWYADMEALHRREEPSMTETGQERYLTWSVGYLELLARRIGLYWRWNDNTYTQDGYLVVTATPPEIIGEFVNREAGPGANPAAPDRRTAGLTLAAIAPAGTAVEERLRATNLLLRCQQIAQGYALDIRMVGNGAALYQFQVGAFLGTDSRIGNLLGNPPVWFSPDRGNMAKAHYIGDRLAEMNHIHVAGQGTGNDSIMYDKATAALIADSPWNLREGWVDSRDLDTVAKLEAPADQELEKLRPIADLEFDCIEIESCRYGRDYDLGDLITAIYRGVQLDYRIEAVTVTVENTGVEKIVLDLVEYP
jgi:hypothetical protein